MAEKSLKKLKETEPIKTKKLTDDKYTNIAFNILAIFCIVLYCSAIVSKTFQNDTYYTIKIGQLIRENGIDFIDHFSWIANLPYTYPHWLYDVLVSLVYDFCGGYTGVYISTVVLSSILGITIFITNKKISKNLIISFFMTWVQLFFLEPYIAARAQLATFILFVLTLYFIEKFLEKPKIIYAIILILIPILIANLHVATFPFYFVLYMPYIGEYLVRVIIDANIFHTLQISLIENEIKKVNNKLKKAKEDREKIIYQKRLTDLNQKLELTKQNFENFKMKQKDRLNNPYKVEIERNDNIRKLALIMLLCAFTGLLTPLKDIPYTYTYKTMQGTSLSSINEHLPLTLMDNKELMVFLGLSLLIPMVTKVKFKLRDLFFYAGLIVLMFATRRQTSMFMIFGGFAVTRMLANLVSMYDKTGTKEMLKYLTTFIGELLIIVLFVSVSFVKYKPNMNRNYVNTSSYPVEATEWIKENLDYKNIKLFNDYNYGSYLLMNDVPVFIDSRCDLYMPEFNGEYDKEKQKYEGQDIFEDYMHIVSLSTYYDTKFDEYEITHVITKNNSKLNMFLKRDTDNYKEIYKDSVFVIYEKIQ